MRREYAFLPPDTRAGRRETVYSAQSPILGARLPFSQWSIGWYKRGNWLNEVWTCVVETWPFRHPFEFPSCFTLITMANSVAIPHDIIDNIIEKVGDDCRLLRKCALVSSSFLLPSRKHLFKFSKIVLRGDEACQRLHQFLVENPVIQSSVRSITFKRDKASVSYLQLNRTSLIAILRLPFRCLESFSTDAYMWCDSPPLNWNDFSSELKDALSTIIHSSTLKTLYLWKVIMPITLFHGIHLTKLWLASLSPNDFIGEQSRLLTSAASEVTTTASHTVIDHCEWNFCAPVHGTRFPTFAYFSLIWEHGRSH